MGFLKTAFFYCMYCTFIATTSIVIKRQALPSNCKRPKSLGWEVKDFRSIISWKRKRLCAPNFSDYTVEMCIMECGSRSGRWIKRTCNQIRSSNSKIKMGMLSCVSNIGADVKGPSLRVCYTQPQSKQKVCTRPDTRYGYVKSRSTFSAPNITAIADDSTSIWGHIQEPTKEFLTYFSDLKYHIRVIDITNQNRTICRGGMTSKELDEIPLVDERIIETYDKNPPIDCDGTPGRCKWKFNDNIRPQSTYCVFATFETQAIEDNNGPSDVGYAVVTTPKKVKDISPTLIASLASVSLIVLLLLILFVIMFRRWRKPIYEINKLFKESMENKHDISEWSGSFLESGSVESATPEKPDIYNSNEPLLSESAGNIGEVNNQQYLEVESVPAKHVEARSAVLDNYFPRDESLSSPDSSAFSTESESTIGSYIQKQSISFFASPNTSSSTEESERTIGSYIQKQSISLSSSTSVSSNKDPMRGGQQVFTDPEVSPSFSGRAPIHDLYWSCSASDASYKTTNMTKTIDYPCGSERVYDVSSLNGCRENDEAPSLSYLNKSGEISPSLPAMYCQYGRRTRRMKAELLKNNVNESFALTKIQTFLCPEEEIKMKHKDETAPLLDHDSAQAKVVHSFSNLPQSNGYMLH